MGKACSHGKSLQCKKSWHKYTSLTDRVRLHGGVPRALSYEALGLSPNFGENVAFLEAYFDESLKREGKRVVVVAGFVSSIDVWASFANEWNVSVLERFGIPYFRMKDFRNAQSRIFRHLSKEERTHLLANVAHLAAEAASFGVVCRTDEDEYNAATTSEYRSRNGTAFTTCFTKCIAMIGHLLSKHTDEIHKLSVFLEEGHANADQALQMLDGYKQFQTAQDEFDENLLFGGHQGNTLVVRGPRDSARYRLDTIAKGSKKSKPPLQVADVLAHTYLCDSQGAIDANSEIILEYWKERIPLYALDVSREIIGDQVSNMQSSEEKSADRNLQTHKIRRAAGALGASVTRTDFGYDLLDTTGLDAGISEEIFRRALGWPASDKGNENG